jgi:DNA invertase Pin-like site-specific DNA recombinase
MERLAIAYLRVSTAKQGQSGLGLEAQMAAITAHAELSGCRLIATYTEVETGKRDDMDNRPELLKAIAHAKRSKATLVIAKMDRLARSVYVLATLHKSSVEFTACDNPTANRLTVQILMAVAENEARMIGERTRAALAAYKARGGSLGASRPECRNLTDEARRRGVEAAARAQIADRLNALGHTTRRGSRWNQGQVSRVLGRAKRVTTGDFGKKA